MTYPYHTDMPKRVPTRQEEEMERMKQLAFHHTVVKVMQTKHIPDQLDDADAGYEVGARLASLLGVIDQHQRTIKALSLDLH